MMLTDLDRLVFFQVPYNVWFYSCLGVSLYLLNNSIASLPGQLACPPYALSQSFYNILPSCRAAGLAHAHPHVVVVQTLELSSQTIANQSSASSKQTCDIPLTEKDSGPLQSPSVPFGAFEEV